MIEIQLLLKAANILALCITVVTCNDLVCWFNCLVLVMCKRILLDEARDGTCERMKGNICSKL